MTKDLSKSDVGVAENHDVPAFEDFFRDRQGSGVGELPVAADKPGRSLRTPDRDGRQGHIDPSLFEDTGFGSQPGGALPRRKQPRCNSHRLRRRRRDLRPGQARCGRQRGGPCRQMQEFAAEKIHPVLPIARERTLQVYSINAYVDLASRAEAGSLSRCRTTYSP